MTQGWRQACGEPAGPHSGGLCARAARRRAPTQRRARILLASLLLGAWLWPSAVSAQSEPTDDRAIAGLRAKAQRHRREGRFDEAAAALREAIEKAPGRKELYEELAQVYEKDRSGPEAEAPVVRPAPAPPRARLDRSPLEEMIEERPAELAAFLGAALALLLALILGVRSLLKRSGDLSVEIELPSGRSGTFSVRLLRTRPPTRRLPPDFEPSAGPSTDLEHHHVSRETLFRGVPAREWWVCMEGRLDDGEVLQRELEIRIVRKRVTRVAFDWAPEACAVEVRLIQEGRPVRGRIAVGGDPDSIRLAKDGSAKLRLQPGRHEILAAGHGRAAEKTIEVQDFDPMTLVFDLGDEGALVFQNCESAVEPYLRGELSVAASALEKAGQAERAALLAARFHQGLGAIEEAAARFAQAGRHLEAGELWAEHGRFEDAARHFETAGDLERAAEMYNADGDLLRAGKAYMDAGDLDSALICYREAGEVPRLIDVLEKKGEFFEAGRMAMQHDQVERAIRNFHRVERRHDRYFQCCRILAEAFQKQGKDELAIQKADEAVSIRDKNELTPKLRVWHADLLDRAGRPDRSVTLLEELRSEHPDEVANLTTRIEAMRRRAAELSISTSSLSLRGKAFGDASRYELHDQIGSGGMGVVYRVTDRRLNREIALKRLPENLKDHPRAVELFLHEAQAAAGLNHPNIVTVHDVDVEGGIYFITMELLRGANLLQLVRARGSLSWADTGRLAIQACAGLGYAHERGLVHRDVKSANLFFTDERIVKIMDFGLAKMAAEVRKATTVTGGTPYYMAPEQSRGADDIDRRADLYSLGVTLFEMVTGHRPFEDGDIAEHHRSTPAPDPRIHGVELPDAFAELLLQLLAKDPDDRPQNATQVATRLRKLLDR